MSLLTRSFSGAMAFSSNVLKQFLGKNPLLHSPNLEEKACTLLPVRQYHPKLVYTDWRMQRDVKRRKVVKEYAKLRINYNCLKRNDILPQQLRDVASAEMHALPRDCLPSLLKRRCVVSSKPRGVVHKWRLSRIVWRHLADYNYLSGVQRAMW